jgi:hypothetical protein
MWFSETVHVALDSLGFLMRLKLEYDLLKEYAFCIFLCISVSTI